MQQLPRDPASNGQLSTATEINLLRFAESMTHNHFKVILFLYFKRESSHDTDFFVCEIVQSGIRA